jgi:hypothetical protein
VLAGYWVVVDFRRGDWVELATGEALATAELLALSRQP